MRPNLFICDMSGLCHSFFHVRKEDDVADVHERVLEKLTRIRAYYSEKRGFENCVFVAVFDREKHDIFRKLKYPEYKANRTRHDDLGEIKTAVWDAVAMSDDWIGLMAPHFFESDDLIASLSAQHDGKVVIYSDDSDMNACIEKDRVMVLKKANVDLETKQLMPRYLNCEGFEKEYGISPSRWNEYQAIVGDASDNLKPISWQDAGEKLAKRVFEHHDGGLDTVDLDCPLIKANKSQRESYDEFVRTLPLHMDLLRMRTDLSWPVELAFLV